MGWPKRWNKLFKLMYEKKKHYIEFMINLGKECTDMLKDIFIEKFEFHVFRCEKVQKDIFIEKFLMTLFIFLVKIEFY